MSGSLAEVRFTLQYIYPQSHQNIYGDMHVYELTYSYNLPESHMKKCFTIV